MNSRTATEANEPNALLAPAETIPVQIVIDLNDLTCPVTQELVFEPVMFSLCGHLVEGRKALSLRACPLCRAGGDQAIIGPLNTLTKNLLASVFATQPSLYAQVNFDYEYFAEILQKNQLQTPTGQRFVVLLQNAPNQLNNPITLALLANRFCGRELLRNNEKIRNSLTNDSLQLVVNEKTLSAWLNLQSDVPAEQAEQKNVGKTVLTSAHGLFAPTSNNVPAQALQPSLESTAQLILHGNEDAVKIQIAANHKLILEKSTGTDYSNRIIADATPLQAALCTGDLELLEIIKQACLQHYANGQEIIDKQITDIFPSGIESHLAEQQQSVFNYNAIATAITHAATNEVEEVHQRIESNSALYQALQQFRDNFTEHSHHEKVFNPLHLLHAFTTYKANFQHWGPGWEKRNIFWRQVIGFVECYVPTCFAQALCQGLTNIVEQQHQLKRSLNIVYANQDHRLCYFPFDANADSRLGRDFVIYSFNKTTNFYGVVVPVQCGSVLRTGTNWECQHAIDALELYYRDRTAKLVHFCHKPQVASLRSSVG